MKTPDCKFCGCQTKLADDSREVRSDGGSVMGRTTPQVWWVECGDFRCGARGPRRGDQVNAALAANVL